jgi:Peptidase M15
VPCPPARKGKTKRYINHLLARPATRRARRSKTLRRHLDAHGWLTPNFAVSEMADTGTHTLPTAVHAAAVRQCWNLERLARELGKRAPGKRKRVAISIDGPYRTEAHNRAIHGAVDSQHVHGDATDHFISQVKRWQREANLSLAEVIAIAARIFTAIGNENSGTLHLDSRPGKPGSVRFTTWIGAR